VKHDFIVLLFLIACSVVYIVPAFESADVSVTIQMKGISRNLPVALLLMLYKGGLFSEPVDDILTSGPLNWRHKVVLSCGAVRCLQCLCLQMNS